MLMFALPGLSLLSCITYPLYLPLGPLLLFPMPPLTTGTDAVTDATDAIAAVAALSVAAVAVIVFAAAANAPLTGAATGTT